MNLADRNTTKLLQREMEFALQTVAKAHGLTIKLAGGSITSSRLVKLAFTVALPDETGQAETKYAASFRVRAEMMGLAQSDLHRQFEWRGIRYRLDGSNGGSHKYPFIATRLSDGALRKLPAEPVYAGLGKTAPSWILR